MVLFTDNDIILKLAAFNLLDEAVELLQGRQIAVLDSAVYRFRKPSRKAALLHNEATFGRAITFCERATQLNNAPHPDDDAALVGAEYEDEYGKTCRIDGGELILFSQTFRASESFLVTGDKNALYAFGRHALQSPAAQRPHVQTMHGSLQKRVVCLEAVVLALSGHLGFNAICERIVPNRECDQAMRATFGSGIQSVQANAHSALNHYLDHAERILGSGWLWRA